MIIRVAKRISKKMDAKYKIVYLLLKYVILPEFHRSNSLIS